MYENWFSALDEARDVFGVEDFNFDEFYDEDEEPVDEDDEDQEDLMDDEGEGEARVGKLILSLFYDGTAASV